jgi:hypothetical protein
VFSHNHNTFDKKKMLENPHPQFCKESPRVIEDFIKCEHEAPIKKFFLEDIDDALASYPLGMPAMKPGVLEQIKKLDEERKAMMQMQNGGGPGGPGEKIMMNRPGEPPIELTIPQVLDILHQQQEHIQVLTKEMQQKDNIIQNLQKELAKKATPIHVNSNIVNTPNNEKSLFRMDNAMVFNVAD